MAAYAVAAGHIPGCLLRKGGDVPGKEVSGAYERLASLPFEAGSFASLAQPYKSRVTFYESPLR
ncbi:hypothetical protein [Paenibacillus polymyxa]|uniref:hypothetical protein n=1 Tax=Paenibacillus polymyxa TaxID=1406 RepID=UPI0010721AC7|nr:hypothetical protein [Paenibacillus polymyxa]